MMLIADILRTLRIRRRVLKKAKTNFFAFERSLRVLNNGSLNYNLKQSHGN